VKSSTNTHAGGKRQRQITDYKSFIDSFIKVI